MTPIGWNLDAHQRAQEVARRFEAGVRRVVPERRPFHRKPYYGDDTTGPSKRRPSSEGIFSDYRVPSVIMVFVCASLLRGEPFERRVQLFLAFRAARNEASSLQRRDSVAFFETLKTEWEGCDQPSKGIFREPQKGRDPGRQFNRSIFVSN